MTQYYIWVDETNKVYSRPKPFKFGDLNDIFRQGRSKASYQGMRIALAIGSREYLEQNYELRSDAFKEQESNSEQ